MIYTTPSEEQGAASGSGVHFTERVVKKIPGVATKVASRLAAQGMSATHPKIMWTEGGVGEKARGRCFQKIRL